MSEYYIGIFVGLGIGFIAWGVFQVMIIVMLWRKLQNERGRKPIHPIAMPYDMEYQNIVLGKQMD